jgi:hypothetical protein
MFSDTNTISAWFPHKFKFVGCVILFITGVLATFLQLGDLFDEIVKSEAFRSGMRGTILIGLFLIASSREKIEDELVGLLRLKSFEWSFRWGILYTIVDLAFPANVVELSGFSLIFSMLIVHLLVFYFKKHTSG